MNFLGTVYEWIDALWIPVCLLVVHKGHRLTSVMYVLACMLTMRLQIEFMNEYGYQKGVLSFMDSDIRDRGMIVYAVFMLLFLVMSYYSPKTNKFVHMVAAITIYMVAFCVSTGVMIL